MILFSIVSKENPPGLLANYHHDGIHNQGGQCVVEEAQDVVLPHVRHNGESRIPNGLPHRNVTAVLKAILHVTPPGDHVLGIRDIIVNRRNLISTGGFILYICSLYIK